VYEKADGTIAVGTMNAGLLGRLFGGVVADVMGGPVAREQREFVAFCE
jgi:ADP-ribosylglycohydrolase